MDPISNQPPPYTLWDIDQYALQKQHRHEIQVPVNVTHLPKPFDLQTEKSKKTEKDLKGKPSFQKKGKCQEEKKKR